MENALSEIAREKQAVRALPSQRGQETQLGHPDVLRLIHDREVKRRIRSVLEIMGQRAEHAGPGHQPLILNLFPHPLENGPEDQPPLGG